MLFKFCNTKVVINTGCWIVDAGIVGMTALAEADAGNIEQGTPIFE
jgi:hypothetical protein